LRSDAGSLYFQNVGKEAKGGNSTSSFSFPIGSGWPGLRGGERQVLLFASFLQATMVLSNRRALMIFVGGCRFRVRKEAGYQQ
jgi:hypothetical protein